jgi:hypothetical protein
MISTYNSLFIYLFGVSIIDTVKAHQLYAEQAQYHGHAVDTRRHLGQYSPLAAF